MVASLVPQSLRPWDTIGYVGDSLGSVYFVAWNARQVFQDPRRVFEANFLHPLERPILLDAHRILPSALVAPVIWLSGNPVLAYNAALAICYLAAAMGARFLALRLGLGPLAAWMAGAIYAFHTYQVNEAPRLNVVAHAFWPVSLLLLVRYLVRGGRRDAWLLGAAVLLQGLSDNYNVLYAVLMLSVVALGALAARPRAVLPRLGGLAPPALACALLFAPVVLAYMESARTFGYAREVPPGIDLQHYVTTAPGNVWYGHMGAPHRLQQRGPHFVGFVALALAALAVAAWVRERGPAAAGDLLPPRVWVPGAAALALLFVALSLGRDVYVFGQWVAPGPYRLLHALVPGFGYIRIPERLALLAMLFIALLAARGLEVARAAGWRKAAVALAVLAPLEHLSPLARTTRVPVGDEMPAVYRWLSTSEARAVAEVPVHGESLVRKETLEEYFSTVHWKPIVHGYVSYPPLLGTLLRKALERFPSETSLQALQRVGVDTVVFHAGREGAGEVEEPLRAAVAAGRLTPLARFAGPAARAYEGTVDEVYGLPPVPPGPAAPMPAGNRRIDPAWQYRTKEGDPSPAADGDLETAWSVPHALDGDEFFEVTFGGPVRVSGLVLPLDRRCLFPLPFRVAGLTEGGWAELARFDEAHVLQVVDQLLRDPGKARLGFDLGGLELRGLRLMLGPRATSFQGWWLPEVEVWVP
jgi:hypothetical protein